jgi:hypothetical protein
VSAFSFAMLLNEDLNWPSALNDGIKLRFMFVLTAQLLGRTTLRLSY